MARKKRWDVDLPGRPHCIKSREEYYELSDKVEELHNDGRSGIGISEATGVPYRSILAIMKALGLKGKRGRPKGCTWSPEQHEKFQARWTPERREKHSEEQRERDYTRASDPEFEKKFREKHGWFYTDSDYKERQREATLAYHEDPEFMANMAIGYMNNSGITDVVRKCIKDALAALKKGKNDKVEENLGTISEIFKL